MFYVHPKRLQAEVEHLFSMRQRAIQLEEWIQTLCQYADMEERSKLQQNLDQILALEHGIGALIQALSDLKADVLSVRTEISQELDSIQYDLSRLFQE